MRVVSAQAALMTATRTTRTVRNARGTYADGGANTQDGKLPIYDCTTCGAEVVWATSNRTGNKYLVNIRTGASGARFYMKHDIHTCQPANSPEDVALYNRLNDIYQDSIKRHPDGTARPFNIRRLSAFIDFVDTDPQVVAMRERLGQ